MTETRITVAHSPDSDDAFMFYGLASGNVDTAGIGVDQVLADIETLNRAAFEGRYEVTAVSFHAFAHLAGKYALLPHGASMGDRYGPIVVLEDRRSGEVKGARIAIPGTLTTAYLALRIYEPDFQYVVVPFDEIQQAVLDGKAEAGLLIHEGQLTYADDGLRKVVDLGEWWAERTGGLPLPLGGNIIRRDLGPDDDRAVSRMLHDSIAYALSHRDAAVEYALQFGRGLDRGQDRPVRRHVRERSHPVVRRPREARARAPDVRGLREGLDPGARHGGVRCLRLRYRRGKMRRFTWTRVRRC